MKHNISMYTEGVFSCWDINYCGMINNVRQTVSADSNDGFEVEMNLDDLNSLSDL